MVRKDYNMSKEIWYVLIITLFVNLLVTCQIGTDVEKIKENVEKIQEILEVK